MNWIALIVAAVVGYAMGVMSEAGGRRRGELSDALRKLEDGLSEGQGVCLSVCLEKFRSDDDGGDAPDYPPQEGSKASYQNWKCN